MIKNNIYNIVVILAIITAYFTYIVMAGESILLFVVITPFFLAIIWFFSRDKQIKELKASFNEKFPLLGKTLAVIFRIFVFLVFLSSIFIVTAGIYGYIEEIKTEQTRALPSPEEKFVQLGKNSVKEGDILWKLSNVIERGKRFDSKYTEGKFVEIWVEIKNLSLVTKQVRISSHNKIKLIDDQKREFSPSFLPLIFSEREKIRTESQTFEYLSNWGGLITLKPGIPTGFKLFFEVAENSNSYLINLYYE